MSIGPLGFVWVTCRALWIFGIRCTAFETEDFQIWTFIKKMSRIPAIITWAGLFGFMVLFLFICWFVLCATPCIGFSVFSVSFLVFDLYCKSDSSSSVSFDSLVEVSLSLTHSLTSLYEGLLFRDPHEVDSRIFRSVRKVHRASASADFHLAESDENDRAVVSRHFAYYHRASQTCGNWANSYFKFIVKSIVQITPKIKYNLLWLNCALLITGPSKSNIGQLRAGWPASEIKKCIKTDNSVSCCVTVIAGPAFVRSSAAW